MGYFNNGTYVGRIWSKKNNGPSVVKIIDNEICDAHDIAAGPPSLLWLRFLAWPLAFDAALPALRVAPLCSPNAACAGRPVSSIIPPLWAGQYLVSRQSPLSARCR